jgi:hypothetical protein
VDGPVAGGGCGGEGLAVHDPVGEVVGAVVGDAFGDGGR